MYAYACMCLCMYVCMYICICMYVSMYVCMHMHVCMYVWRGKKSRCVSASLPLLPPFSLFPPPLLSLCTYTFV